MWKIIRVKISEKWKKKEYIFKIIERKKKERKEIKKKKVDEHE